jgi:hypothetical protein
MYHETIDKAIFIAKRFRPLHRQLRNLYRQNKAYQAQIRKLKMELQPFKEELAKRNLDMLAKFATRGAPESENEEDEHSLNNISFDSFLFMHFEILRMVMPYKSCLSLG